MANRYLNRLNMVLTYIHQNLQQDLSLLRLSSVAAFSPFHFHRIFKSYLGENVNDYVNRIRLERSARLLSVNRRTPVTDIALDCGFSSSSVFSRAFKQYYGVSPSDFRKNRNPYHISNNCKEVESLDLYTESNHYSNLKENPMKVEIVRYPSYKVAYCRHLEGYEKGIASDQITEAFSKVAAWMEVNRLFRENTLCLGIYYDYQDLTPAKKRCYDAAFTIPEEIQAGNDEIGIQTLEGGTYAVVTVEVDNTSESSFAEAIRLMDQGFDYIYGHWLAEHNVELEDRPCLEIYRTGPDAPVVRIDACVPLKS